MIGGDEMGLGSWDNVLRVRAGGEGEAGRTRASRSSDSSGTPQADNGEDAARGCHRATDGVRKEEEREPVREHHWLPGWP